MTWKVEQKPIIVTYKSIQFPNIPNIVLGMLLHKTEK